MDGSDVVGSGERKRVLNAVPLGNAVLCAECDVVSDSPHDVCLVCGSHSLFNVARIFGGNLPKKRARLITMRPVEAPTRQVMVLAKPHRSNWRTTEFRQLSAVAVKEHGTETDPAMLVRPQGD